MVKSIEIIEYINGEMFGLLKPLTDTLKPITYFLLMDDYSILRIQYRSLVEQYIFRYNL